MSLTPLDIENKEFSKAIRGYNVDEVEAFLDKILKEYERMYKENQNLKNEVSSLEKQLENYKGLESDLKDTLLMAQKASEEVKSNAEKEAELIYEKAVTKAKKIVQTAEDEARKRENEIYRLKETFIKYKSEMKSLLQVQLDLLEKNDLLDKNVESNVSAGSMVEEISETESYQEESEKNFD